MARWTALLLVSLLVLLPLVQGATTIPLKQYASGTGVSDGGEFGHKVLKMKDFDGDGVMDIAVSAYYDNTGGTHAGAVYIYKGPFTTSSDLSPSKARTVLLGTAYDHFGTSMDTGDFNGDGLSDLIISAEGFENNVGAAFIFLGGNTTNRTEYQADATFTGSWEGEKFGHSVSSLGNLNGDRFDDFAIGEAGSNDVYVYTGRQHLTTEVMTLPEVPQDYPNPVDFTHGLNSTGNTFGLGNTTDGWDWSRGIYGGSSNDVVFPPVGGSKHYASIVMGSLTDGNTWNPCPAASGGFGVEFNISQRTIDAMKDGAQVHMKFSWEAANTGLNHWVGEVYWIKARIWNSSVNQTWLGSSWDGDNNPADDENMDATTDATNELYYDSTDVGSTSLITNSGTPDTVINDVINGAHTYYLDAGGKLSDWWGQNDNLTVRITNVTVYSAFDPIVTILGPAMTAIGGPGVYGLGDVNGDGFDDLGVGIPNMDQVRVYYGSPHFGQDFQLYEDLAFPERQGKNDTTSEPNVNDLKYNDGNGYPWSTGWYIVDRGQEMDVEGWDTGSAKGELLYAWLFSYYTTDWQYNGDGWLTFSVPKGAWTRTGLQPVQTWGSSYGPDDIFTRGVRTLPDLQTMAFEFSNNAPGGGGARAVYFDYLWVYFIAQMAANVTVQGPGGTSAFGASVSALGSINGDPYDDLIIGAPGAKNSDGAAYVFLGGKDLAGNLTDKDAFATFTGAPGSSSETGTMVGSAGLFSLDKFPDIAISSKDGNGTLYIVRGGPRITSGVLKNVAQYSFQGEQSSSVLPFSVAPLGDINGGHCGEILASDRYYMSGGKIVGKVYILYNSDEDLLKQSLVIDHYPKGDQTLKERDTLGFGIVVRDPTELNLEYVWTLDGKTVAYGTPAYTYQPDYGTAGDHKLQAYVADGFRDFYVVWNVTVLKVNFPPQVTFYPAKDPTIFQGDAVRFWASALDPDGDPLAYSWVYDGMPVPGIADPGYIVRSDDTILGDHTVSLSVSDGRYSLNRTWTVHILDVNRPPVIDSASPVSDPAVLPGSSQGFIITAHDPDGDPLTVVWSVDGQTAALGTYAYEQSTEAGKTGTHYISVEVSDGQYTVGRSWVLTATKGNQAPIIDWVRPPSPVELDEGGSMVFWLSAHDPDGDAISTTWTLDGTRVIGNQSYDFRVPSGPKGSYSLVATVTDGKLSTNYTWAIKVNRAPVIVETLPTTGKVLNSGQSVSVAIKATDADRDEMTVNWYINEKLSSVDKIPSSPSGGSSVLKFTAPFDTTNDINLKVVVTDGRLSAQAQWKFNVTKVSNTPPTAIIKYSPLTPNKGKAMSFDGTGSTDPEGDIIAYDWAFSDGTTAHGKNVSKTFSSNGELTVTLTVTDSKGNTAQASKVLSFSGPKLHSAAQSPFNMILFVILLVVLVGLIVYQSFRKGWIGPKKDEADDYHEDLASRTADLDKEPKEEQMEPDKEPVAEGGFEELPLEEDKDM